MSEKPNGILGYTELTKTQVAEINRVKAKAAEVGKMIDTLEADDIEHTIDKRWLNVARTDLQKGFMALTRSIANPTTF